MSNITAALVKELREITGAGMMQCKNALVKAQGDFEAAKDILAASTTEKAQKSATRSTSQGVSSACTTPDQSSGIIFEANCETDFVAKDSNFKEFVLKLGEIAIENNIQTLDELVNADYAENVTVEKARESLVAKLGENIQIRRFERLNAPEGGVVAAYVHGDRISVLLSLTKPVHALARDLAMQVAAMNPQYIDPKDVPEAVVAKEKAILVERSKEGANSNKPADILEKILSGQLNKYLNEMSLVGQAFVKNPDETVGSLLKKNDTQVAQMLRFELGEGMVIEKKSFRDEVMEQVSKI